MTAPAELLQGWPGLHHTHQFNRLVVLHQGRKSKYMQKSSSKGFHSKTSSVNNFDESLLLLSFTSLIIVHNRCMMAILRSCCLCFSTRTGSFVLGTVGIILGATLLAPMAVFLDYHSYYITQFVASERVGGNYIDDDQVNFCYKICLYSDISACSGSKDGVLQQDAVHSSPCARRHLCPLLCSSPCRHCWHKVTPLK